MTRLPSMPMFWGDYFADTRHLTTEQHGAYLLLLGSMWMAGGSLPDNDRQLANIAGVSLQKWRKIAPVIRPFFTISDDGRLTHKRVEKEKDRVTNFITRQRSNGSRRWQPNPLNNNETDDAMALPSHIPRDASGICTQTHRDLVAPYEATKSPPQLQDSPLVTARDGLLDGKPPPRASVARPQPVFVESGTAAWDAWKRVKPTIQPQQLQGTTRLGWWFPSEFPEQQRAAE